MTTDDLKNLLFDTFGPMKLNSEVLTLHPADAGLVWLGSQLELGNTAALPGILRDFFDIDATDAEISGMVAAHEAAARPLEKPTKRRIDIETIDLAHAVLADLNRLDLRDVEFYSGGVLIPVTAEHLDEFRVTGLSNRDFVRMRMWETEPNTGGQGDAT